MRRNMGYMRERVGRGWKRGARNREVLMDVGTEIKNLRQLRGLTQTELALRADVHRLTILRIENHHPHEMRFDMIDKIFRALGMQLKLEPVDLSARPTPDATTSTDSTV